MTSTMHTGTKPALDIRELVLTTLGKRPHRPTDLFEVLKTKASEEQLKTVLAALLESHVIELSPDRHLKMSERRTRL
jgi:hypothetical protein